MKSYSLYLDEANLHLDFYPLTLNRSFSELRTGLFTIKERWLRLAEKQSLSLTFTVKEQADFSIAANLVPHANLDLEQLFNNHTIENEKFTNIHRIWDLVHWNIPLFLQDVQTLDKTAYTTSLPKNILITGDNPIYIHPTAKTDHCFINTENGAVVIGENVQIMAGAMLRGPIYIGAGSVVKMGATLYEGTNIGNNCIVGGEIKNSIFHANSNKSHHGYLGDSYIGEWCNMGAGTTCSNLKNTAGKIKVWDMQSKAYRLATEKVGVFMGDFVRTAVNTAINSGTIIGSFANVFSKDVLSPKYIPPFSWGNTGTQKYELEKLMGELEKWMKMKGQTPNEDVKQNIVNLYNQY
ncbi:MAG: hypothetical protein RLZZ595_1887 [Bacteroidota bacterium]